MKDLIQHQLRFSVATGKDGQLLRAEDHARMTRTQSHFREARADIKFWEIPLNRVTFLKIFSSYLDSIGVKCFVRERAPQSRNLQLFELNLFCHFYYSLQTGFSEKRLKHVLFEMIDLDPRTIIKKTDIVVLARDELSPAIVDLHSGELDAAEEGNFFLVFIRRAQNEFEIKSIFRTLARKYPGDVRDLHMHYLMPKFELAEQCIGGWRLTRRALGHRPAFRVQRNSVQNVPVEVLLSARVHSLRAQNQPQRFPGAQLGLAEQGLAPAQQALHRRSLHKKSASTTRVSSPCRCSRAKCVTHFARLARESSIPKSYRG